MNDLDGVFRESRRNVPVVVVPCLVGAARQDFGRIPSTRQPAGYRFRALRRFDNVVRR